jgi:hypothetical protein
MLGRASRWLAPAVSWLVVAVLVLATWAGLVSRYLTPADAPYLLLTRDVGDHPVRALALLASTAAAYAALYGAARLMVDRWRDGVDQSDIGPGVLGRLYAGADWAFSRWWRFSLVLAVVWLPWYVSSFPGQPSPDPANMITEFLSTRSDFADAPPFADGSGTAPWEDYPTSAYLMTDGDSLWSNHHPFFTMLGYGALCSLSIALFDSLVPGLVAASALSAVLTLVVFGRAFAIVGTLVTSRRVRLAALVILTLSPMVALWSMAQHKNQIFCAAFVWWLALLARLVHGEGRPTRRWYAETVAASLLMAVSVQFGWIVLVAQTVALVATRRHRVAALLAVGLPALLVQGSIVAMTSSGMLIPSDPIETKGAQLQVLGLVLAEHPDALTASEREDLSRIFDLDAFVASFDPSSSDPLKSTGPLERKSASFRYATVQPEDWDDFNRIVLDVASRYPATALDGLFLTSYRYLDPVDEGTDWYPPWNPAYDRTIEGHRVAPLDVNLAWRGDTRALAYDCYGQSWCRPTISHGVRTVVVVVLLAAAIGVRRRWAWLWTLPFALQLAIAGVSPLSAGGRYVLAFTYALALVVMLLAIPDRTPSGSRGSSTPSRTPSPAPSPQA